MTNLETQERAPTIGQQVRHMAFDVTGTITDYDANLNVYVVTLDQPMPRLDQSLAVVRAPAGALEVI